MASYEASKQTFADQMIALSRRLLQIAEDLDALNAAYSVHGFNSGGAHPYADGDFTSTNTHLTAATVADTMFAVGTLDGALTTGIRNALRSCIPGGSP